MKKISKSTGLSREYTNHCVRSTSITVLNEAGFEGRHIVRVSGHKNEMSLKSYAHRVGENIYQKMSESLSSASGQNSLALVPSVPRQSTHQRTPESRNSDVLTDTHCTGSIGYVENPSADVAVNISETAHFSSQQQQVSNADHTSSNAMLVYKQMSTIAQRIHAPTTHCVGPQEAIPSIPGASTVFQNCVVNFNLTHK